MLNGYAKIYNGTQRSEEERDMRNFLLVVSIVFGLAIAGTAMYFNAEAVPTVEKRGCCSWHDGVCGCKDNRVVCCDGTLSPSCTC